MGIEDKETDHSKNQFQIPNQVTLEIPNQFATEMYNRFDIEIPVEDKQQHLPSIIEDSSEKSELQSSQKNNKYDSKIKSHTLQKENENEKQKEIETPKGQFNLDNNSSFFAKVFMIDMLKLIFQASKDLKKYKVLSSFNLPQISEKISLEYNYKLFTARLDKKIEELSAKEKQVTPWIIIQVFLQTFKYKNLLILSLNCIGIIFQLLSSVLIALLIESIQDRGITSQAYAYACGLNVAAILTVLCFHNAIRFNFTVACLFRHIFMKIIFTKVSTLSSFQVKQANVGKLVNVISNDLCSIEPKSIAMYEVLSIPIPLIAVTAYLIVLYGAFGLLAVMVMLLLSPIQLFFSNISSKYFSDKTKLTDARVNLANEAVEGIRLIKMYAWEKAFIHSINVLRNIEIKKILMIIILSFSDRAVAQSFCLFIVFILMQVVYDYGDQGDIKTAFLFTSLNLLDNLKSQVVEVIGFGFTAIFHFRVVLQRMITILYIKSISMRSIEENKENQIQNSSMDKGYLKLVGFTAFWEEKVPVLKDLNMSIQKGECICLVGQVGSGKSSLLNCILGEVPLYKGSIHYNGKLAFVEQEPYIFSQSVKDNIVFGSEFNESLYKRVVKACSLEQDIASFDLKDETIIGERGVNISGGQKARISLARAMYSQADIYLLDDPLSAVDSKVAKKLFFDVIKELSKNSTVILATHQIHFTKHSDRIYILEQGQIIQSGVYEDLKDNLQKLSSELHHINDTSSFQQPNQIFDIEQENNDDEEELDYLNEDNVNKQEMQEQYQEQDIQLLQQNNKKINDTNEDNQLNQENEVKQGVGKGKEDGDVKKEEKQDQQKQIFKQEEDVRVSLKTYLSYLKLSNVSYFLPFIVGLYVANEIVYIYFNQLLGDYDGSEHKQNLISTIGYLVAIYLVNYFLKYLLMCLSVSASGQNLHRQMLNALFRAKVLYFDRTPSGQILNRFSTDIGTIDQDLCNILMEVLDIFVKLIVLFITIMTITPYFIIVAACELIIFVFFIKFSKQGLLQIKQLDLKNRSPVFTFFNLTIQGVLPIRTYGQQINFEKQFNVLASNSLKASLYYWLSQRGFGGTIHLFATICNSIGIFLIISITTSSSEIGQSLTYFMVTTSFLQWGIRQLIQLDVSMTSVQRCLNIVNVDEEPPLSTQYDHTNLMKKVDNTDETNLQKNKGKKEVCSFPEKGELIFKNVSMRYRNNLNLVLNNLSFHISPGQRVGFIGRTGAGKSSIIQALFRMTEIESKNQEYLLQTEQMNNLIEEENVKEEQGFIQIDGHDIRHLGIHTLRQGITIIPQVPFIFSGTIRRNLDPLNQYSDEQINNVLIDIGLYEKVYELKENLKTDMTNANQVFSSGQKQLICLGRAILRQSKLIVLDEATANCDMLTDELIQAKIRQRFSQSTIITIAHRLNTIADYDQVIVIDQGTVIEQGSPYQLLLKQGVFHQMVQHTGKKNSEIIFQIAEKNKKY